MAKYVIGANILENLTIGMYQDSKVIYREYIQNCCDQIDKAVKENILTPGEGKIEIWLDYGSRTITIEDNATGIPAELFQEKLGNIADSDKIIGEDKGFRGIGRLCGLAYCRELVFTSSAKGENIISILRCDAEKMRNLISENAHGHKHTVVEVLNAINVFEVEKTNDTNLHFFKVELIGINIENTDLLDFKQIKDYLSFVAPVPYQNSFYFRTELYDHVQRLGIELDEYNIALNGEPVFKKYTTVLREPSGNKYDDIFGVHFKDFYDDDGELFAWMWIALSKFRKAIPKINQMRGLRLRKDNIQIGGEDALQKLFKEDRGNGYFVGEVFALSKDLIPNSQRDYFNENVTRAYFEKDLRRYFNEELHKIYYDGSAYNSAYKKIDSFEKKDAEYKQKEVTGSFIDYRHREAEFKAVLDSKKEAELAQVRIEKLKNTADDIMIKVIERIESERPQTVPTHKLKTVHKRESEKKTPHRADKLSQYSKNERKLISKIFGIILQTIDSENAEKIISRIEEEL